MPPFIRGDDPTHFRKNIPQAQVAQRPVDLDGGMQRNMPANPAMSQGAAAPNPVMKPGMMYAMKKGGKVGSASKRADGIAKRGKTKGRIV